MLDDYIRVGEDDKKRENFRFWVIYFVLALAVIGFISYIVYSRHIRKAAFDEQGVKAIATLDDQYKVIKSRRETKTEVTYTFYANGKQYAGKSYLNSPPQRTMEVIYAANNPELNRLVDSSFSVSALWLEISVFGIFLILFLFMEFRVLSTFLKS